MLSPRTLIIGAVVLAVIAGAFFAWNYEPKQEVSTHEPIEIVHNFYQPWLEAAQSDTTDPYQEGLAKSPLLSSALRKHLKSAKRSEDGVDPVLCRSTVPENIALRPVFEVAEKVEILVTARQSDSTEQAVVTLLPLDGGWYIAGIKCSVGEVGEDREFPFDREGHLLKSVPEPLDARYWHLIYADNGVSGHFVPLFFSADSDCRALNGSASVCAPDTFMETAKVRVLGDTTEQGVEVKRLEFVQ